MNQGNKAAAKGTAGNSYAPTGAQRVEKYRQRQMAKLNIAIPVLEAIAALGKGPEAMAARSALSQIENISVTV